MNRKKEQQRRNICHLGNLTDDDKKLLTRVRAYCTRKHPQAESHLNDYTLLKFLRARKFNINDTEILIDQYAKFV